MFPHVYHRDGFGRFIIAIFKKTDEFHFIREESWAVFSHASIPPSHPLVGKPSCKLRARVNTSLLVQIHLVLDGKQEGHGSCSRCRLCFRPSIGEGHFLCVVTLSPRLLSPVPEKGSRASPDWAGCGWGWLTGGRTLPCPAPLAT